MRQFCATAICALIFVASPAFAQENPARNLERSFATLVDDGWEPLMSLGMGVVMIRKDNDYALCNLQFMPERPVFEAPCYQITE